MQGGEAKDDGSRCPIDEPRSALPRGGSPWYQRVVQDREIVFAHLPRQGRGAEIGVWAGDFSQECLDRARPIELHLVDPWLFVTDDDHAGAGYAGRRAASQTQMDELHSVVTDRFSSDPRVRVHRMTSLDAVSRLPLGHLDWVYLDGDHSYREIAADLSQWSQRLRPGGILAGDDYGNAGWWGDSVVRAVDEFIEYSGCDVLALESQQFVLRMGPR